MHRGIEGAIPAKNGKVIRFISALFVSRPLYRLVQVWSGNQIRHVVQDDERWELLWDGINAAESEPGSVDALCKTFGDLASSYLLWRGTVGTALVDCVCVCDRVRALCRIAG